MHEDGFQILAEETKTQEKQASKDVYSPQVILEKVKDNPDLFITIPEAEEDKFLEEMRQSKNIGEYILTRLVHPQKRVKVEYSSHVIPQEELESVVERISEGLAGQTEFSQDTELVLSKVATSLEEFNTWLKRPTISEIKVQNHLERRAWRNKMRDLLDEKSSMDEEHESDVTGPFSDLYEQNKLKGTNISKISHAIQKIHLDLSRLGIDTSKVVKEYKYINARTQEISKIKNPILKRLKQKSLVWAIDSILMEIVETLASPE